MALPWKQVESKPEFQNLTPEQKMQAQEQYFNEVVAPQAGDQVEGARQQFFTQYNYAAPEEPGFFGNVMEFFTGEQRETQATRELPEIAEAPGLLATEDPVDVAAFSAGFLTATDPQEIANMMTTMFPETIGIQYDEKGNIIAANNKTGQRAVINKPGVSLTDLAQTLGIGAAFAPGTGRVAGTVMQQAGKQALKAGAISTVIESGQEQLGGELNVSNIVLDMITAGAGEAIPQYLKFLKDKRAKEATEATAEAVTAEKVRLGEELSPEQLAIQQRETTERVAMEARAGLRGDLAEVATAPAPDPQIAAAAERLGVSDVLTPGQVSGSQAYRELEGSIAALPVTQVGIQRKEAIKKVAQTADDLITAYGGTTDKAALSERLKDKVIDNIDELDIEAGYIYDQINKVVPRTQKVDTSSISDFLRAEADVLGGEQYLEPLQRRILKLADTNPSYALLDKERKKIGAALNKSKGPYKDADTGALKQLYGALTEAQEGSLQGIEGAADLWGTAKQLVSQRKALEEQSIQLLGKDLAGAIMPKVGRALKKLSAGDYRDFDKVIKALPKDERETAVLSAMNDVFTTGARAEKQLSAPGFADWYESLSRNKAAFERVKNNLPSGAAERLDDLYQVSKGLRQASREEIKTGVVQGLLDNFDKADGMIDKLYKGVKFIPGADRYGVIAGALGKMKADPIRESVDNLLSSSEFKKAVNAYADTSVKAKTKQAAADRALQRSEKYQKWYDRMPNETKQRIAKLGLITWLSGIESEPKLNQ